MDLAELEYMKENHDYMQDFCLSLPQVIQVEKLYEKATETCKALAEGNIEKEKQISDMQTKNQELQYEFDEKQEQLKKLMEAYQQKKASVSKESMRKLVNAKSIELNKESHQILKDFKKKNLTTEQFIEQYKLKRREFHRYNMTKETISAANI